MGEKAYRPFTDKCDKVGMDGVPYKKTNQLVNRTRMSSNACKDKCIFLHDKF